MLSDFHSLFCKCLTINRVKCKFTKVTGVYLCKVVDREEVCSVNAKEEAGAQYLLHLVLIILFSSS